MHILLTNDDGITAPGLAALAECFQKEHQLSIVAPDRNWSASGHVKTMHRPIRVWETELVDGLPAFSTDGAPSDCVSLAALGLIEDPIDVVVSGINPYANMGHDVTYSGTVAAAMEATIYRFKGLAISLNGSRDSATEVDYSAAAEIALKLANNASSLNYPQGVLLNVNIPNKGMDQIKGIKITQQGRSVYKEELIRRQDPRGQTYYWIGSDPPTGLLDPGTDFSALAEDYVSVTPLQLDLTAHSTLKTFEDISL
jgi:5'-nucleotidase